MIFFKKCPCGNKIKIIKLSLIERTKYCCLPCKYKYKKRPSGLKYKIVEQNPTWFKKGQRPIFTGADLTLESRKKMSESKKGQRCSPNTEFKKGTMSGPQNNKWKGNGVGYFGLHSWIYRTLGRPKKCEECGKTHRRIEWANKSHKYKRDISDWKSLCKKCHGQYDKGENWGLAAKKYGKYYETKKK